jgi:8-oxo-dGTP pyrophosphatase MutT (NUDIX family)
MSNSIESENSINTNNQLNHLPSEFEQKLQIPKFRIFRDSDEPDFLNEIAMTKAKKCITSIIFYNYYKGKIYILVQKRSKVMTHPGELCSPGGNIDEKETWIDGLRREILEEVGLDLDKTNLNLFCVHHDFGFKNKDMYNVVFAAKLNYHYKFIEPTHSDELDKDFCDYSQKKIKNYHRWIEKDKLLNEKEGRLLYFFKVNLIKFLKIKYKKEKMINSILENELNNKK